MVNYFPKSQERNWWVVLIKLILEGGHVIYTIDYVLKLKQQVDNYITVF